MVNGRHILLLLIAFLTGCESEVNNVKLPDFKPQIVISAFITPGNNITYADVSTTKRVFGVLGNDILRGAVSVTISDGEKETIMTRSGDRFFFRNESNSISPGKTYSLKVISQYYPEASSSCTVPDRIRQNITLDTFSIARSEMGFNWNELMFRLSFDDQPGKENFYRVILRYIAYSSPTGYRKYTEDYYIPLEKELFTDKKVNSEGKFTIEDRLNFYPSTYNDSAFLKVYILNTDNSYYLFHKSIGDYDNNPSPFSEPSLVYSNINGGVGIFSSFTSDSLIFRLK
ncbi:MAG TPA: DUF4249 domain-containing protein [Bacteroidales bacterium]|nr:DUF4249 domain-containing protein [Bacteroidales bacterium]